MSNMGQETKCGLLINTLDIEKGSALPWISHYMEWLREDWKKQDTEYV